MDKHRFNVGDVITSSRNKNIRYLIKEVGVKNELGGLDYVVEDISDDERFNGKVRRISIGKVDTWGVLIMWDYVDDYLLTETIMHLKTLIVIDKESHLGCDVQYYQRDIEWLKDLKKRLKGE